MNGSIGCSWLYVYGLRWWVLYIELSIVSFIYMGVDVLFCGT